MKELMKKMSILVVALLLVITLGACDKPIECDEGYIVEEGECVLEVIPDTTAPVITGFMEVNLRVDDDEPDYAEGVTANDETDGDVTASIEIDSSAVDMDTEGTYVVTITATDAAGNVGTATFNVVVGPPLSPEEKLSMDFEAIDMDALTEGYFIKLPVFSNNGTLFFWATSHPDVITNRGYIVPPGVGMDPVTVTLTATGKNSGVIVKHDYEITVQPFGEVEIAEKVSLPFTGTSEEYVVENKTGVNVYYEEDGTVPYMDIEEFVDMVDGAIQADELTYTVEGNVMTISYTSEYEDFDGTIVTETMSAVLDFEANTFHVDTFDFFGGYVAETESDYGAGLTYVDAYYEDSVPVTIPLGLYNVDLVVYDDNGDTQYLMPFHVANLLFLGDIYYNAYYNGDAIYGLDTFELGDDLPIHTEARTSSLNGTDMAEDMRWATMNFMALAFDYFYGLKEDKGIDSFRTGLINKSKIYLEGSTTEIYNAIYDFAYGLDDLHTSHTFTGYYANPEYELSLSLSDLGTRSKAFYEKGIWAMQDAIEAKYGSMDARPEYELLDNDTICVYHLDGFNIDTPDEFKAVLDSLPETVDSVVIDLSYNTGGNVGAVFRMFGYMTEEQFLYHSQNPADDSKSTYFIESDYVAYDYEWYIITSKVTFSAANLMASMAQEQGIATVMGQPSSGGASSIGALFTPDGTALIISTNNVISTRSGNEVDGYLYESVEFGITPDLIMGDVTSDEQIIAKVHPEPTE